MRTWTNTEIYLGIVFFLLLIIWLVLWRPWKRCKCASSYILIVLGIYLLASAGCQEFRGDTVRPAMYLPFTRRAILDRGHNHAYQFRIHVLKKNNPELFREFMEAHWLWAVLIEAAGIVLLVRNDE
ncbi:MAG: hypothetical protein ABSA83_22380 [Verrucomicrobiota bacterium]|jgi:hypothetical protein